MILPLGGVVIINWVTSVKCSEISVLFYFYY